MLERSLSGIGEMLALGTCRGKRKQVLRRLAATAQISPRTDTKTGLGLLWILRGHWKWICYADAQMAIELDDGQHLHNPDACGRDQRKNVLLQQSGYRVLRFLCEDVGRCLDEVLDAIIRALSHRAEQEHDKQQSEWNSFDRITTDITRMNGEPCIRNFRLTALRVLEPLAIYPDRAELKREYPELEDEDIRKALAFAAASSRSPSLAPAYDAMRLLLDQGLPRSTVLYLRLLSCGVTS